MRNQYMIKYKNAVFAILALLLLIFSVLAFLTYIARDTNTTNSFFQYAISNHLAIMIILIAVSIAVGYFWSIILSKEIASKTKTSKDMIDIIMLFLGSDEKKILKFLVKNDGKTTQAEVSRIQGLNKVKSHRSLQKMQEKQIIDIVPHGKIRHVGLKKDILDMIRES